MTSGKDSAAVQPVATRWSWVSSLCRLAFHKSGLGFFYCNTSFEIHGHDFVNFYGSQTIELGLKRDYICHFFNLFFSSAVLICLFASSQGFSSQSETDAVSRLVCFEQIRCVCVCVLYSEALEGNQVTFSGWGSGARSRGQPLCLFTLWITSLSRTLNAISASKAISVLKLWNGASVQAPPLIRSGSTHWNTGSCRRMVFARAS